MAEAQHVPTPSWLRLAPGERVALRAQPSMNLLLAGFAVGFVVLVVVASALAVVGDVALGRRITLGLSVLLMATLVAGFVAMKRREYVVTSDRACVAVGLSSPTVTSIALDDVEEVTLEQDGWRRWLGVGDLRFDTADGETLRFGFVEEPRLVYENTLRAV